MVMYYIVMGIVFFVLLLGLYWLTGRIFTLFGVIQIGKWKVRAIRILLSILLCIICLLWDAGGIVAVHLIILYALMDLIAIVVRRVCKKKNSKIYLILKKSYHLCMFPIVVTGLLLTYGSYNMNQIQRTEYKVTSGKLKNDYKIIFISDTHYGTVQKPDIIKEKIREIKKIEPDLMILGGDIVEEGTTKEEMREVFRLFSGIKPRYGIYYIYGNHDRQMYAPHPSYTDKELENSLKENGITALKDDCISLGTDLLIAGREDISRGRESREDTGKILKGNPENRYVILADHQPVQIEENVRQGVDLQLSGHTHAGQFFPIGYMNTLFGTCNYGMFEIGESQAIVSSGMGGWGFPFRTQGICEYVEICLFRE